MGAQGGRRTISSAENSAVDAAASACSDMIQKGVRVKEGGSSCERGVEGGGEWGPGGGQFDGWGRRPEFAGKEHARSQ